MTVRGKFNLFFLLGCVAVLVAVRVPSLPVYWCFSLIMTGGWSITVSSFYMVKLYADQKDVYYYLMGVCAVLFGLGMLSLTLFWLWTFVH